MGRHNLSIFTRFFPQALNFITTTHRAPTTADSLKRELEINLPRRLYEDDFKVPFRGRNRISDQLKVASSLQFPVESRASSRARSLSSTPAGANLAKMAHRPIRREMLSLTLSSSLRSLACALPTRKKFLARTREFSTGALRSAPGVQNSLPGSHRPHWVCACSTPPRSAAPDVFACDSLSQELAESSSLS